MKSANLISVVIPVRNRQSIVLRTLDCLSRQSAPAFDIILVDNGSTDNTLDVLHRWKQENESDRRPVKVLEQPQPGACLARNTGLAEVATPWVLFFDSDDEMLPNHISRVLEGIADYPEADVLGWNEMYSERGIKHFATRDCLWNNLFEGSFATHRWAARTSLVRRAGSWNPEVKLWNDIELGSRILAQNPVIKHLGKDISVQIHPQEESISTNLNGDYADRIEAPLASIRRHLPEKCGIWTEYIRMIVAGNTARTEGGREKAKTLRDKVLARAPRIHRPLLWATYHFRRLGGRGQNHILKLLLPQP